MARVSSTSKGISYEIPASTSILFILPPYDSNKYLLSGVKDILGRTPIEA